MSKKNDQVPLPGRIVRGTSRAGMGGGALLIGLALFLLFRGFGPGGTGSSGSGTGVETRPTGVAQASVLREETEQTTESQLAAPDSIIGGLTDDESKALSGNILTVLIDDYSYMIELPGKPDATFRPAKLSRIVQLASTAKGDSNGIKVRVLIRQSARASAEKQLQADLEHSGISRDAIMMTSEFVP
jgi:hypothetical protein